MMGAVVLTEVICDHPSRGSAAFGLTFSDRGMASQFARQMRRAGYSARLSRNLKPRSAWRLRSPLRPRISIIPN